MEVKRLFDFAYYELETYNLKEALVTKYDGVWKATSSQEYIDLANKLSRAMISDGLGKDSKVAIISSNNRTEWNIVDVATGQIGAQNVPIYPTISSEDYEYILNHSESEICFVSDSEVFEKIDKIKDKVPSLKAIYSFDSVKNCEHWHKFLDKGEDQSLQETVDTLKNAVSENDLATIIYTSGTTGRPKGVMLSHKNIVSNAINCTTRLPIEFGKAKALSFLPLCHVYERMLLYLYQYTGTSIYFAESIDTISDNLKEVKPEIMTAVPRLLEKVYDKIVAKGTDLTGIKKNLFFWALDLGLKWEPYNANGFLYNIKLSIARKLIFSKWQEALGGNIKAIASGAAALQPRLARVFNAAGIPVMEGYGLTETSPVIAVNDIRNGGFRIGTVGKPIPDTDVKIAEDGEILINGPQRMIGYYKDPEKTKEVINKDGYFHTGDIGEIDADGFLKITDRKKEMFKTSGGKYIAPQVLENTLKQSRFIEQIMVIGEGQKMPAALIQPNFEFLEEWANRKELKYEGLKELCAHDRVVKRYQKEVDFYNQNFGKWEQIKKFELTPELWTIEDEHLTPTMKLKRRNIKERYQKLIEKIYA
ncbi:MAG: AMP-dependent synthetase/ligase [Flavobacteriaceae bacterium]|nr:AMP-dependent synthetase/ligase [Flavobacteriaceae bacterium]